MKRLLHAGNRGAALGLGLAHGWVGDQTLRVAHAGVNVQLVRGNPERAVRGDGEPRVNLPDEVEEDEEWQGEVRLEEAEGTGRPAEWLGEGHVSD